MLKLIVDFGTMLIGSGRRETPAGKASQRETPHAQSAEEAPGPPAESERLVRKSTGKFNRALL